MRGYKAMVEELLDKYPVGEPIAGDQAKKDFIKLYGAILRLQNILSAFDEFTGNEILTERNTQDYHSMYIDLYTEFRKTGDQEKEVINDDLVFEMELIKQVEINIDYILELVKKYHQDHSKNKEILVDIHKAIDASVGLRNKKDLILQFIDTLDAHSVIEEAWQTYIETKRREELEEIIKQENLNPEETYKFMQNAFRNGYTYITTASDDLAEVLPPISRFTSSTERASKRQTVLDKITAFFKRFFDISSKEVDFRANQPDYLGQPPIT